jgi:hypothetical protein
MEPLPANLPTLTCSECGEKMRLVGLEHDPVLPTKYVLTFECPRGHIAATKFPG